jgi:hypothetical protein
MGQDHTYIGDFSSKFTFEIGFPSDLKINRLHSGNSEVLYIVLAFSCDG